MQVVVWASVIVATCVAVAADPTPAPTPAPKPPAPPPLVFDPLAWDADASAAMKALDKAKMAPSSRDRG
jgi:hypothetical protein